MTWNQIVQIGNQYDARFGNLDEVCHPSIMAAPEFGKLMQQALDRDSPLARSEVEKVFGTLAWEW